MATAAVTLQDNQMWTDSLSTPWHARQIFSKVLMQESDVSMMYEQCHVKLVVLDPCE